MAKDKKKPKEDKSKKGASSTRKKETADRSGSVTSARSRVDKDLGSGEHGSRPHTSGTPGRASADPYLLPLYSNRQVTLPKSLLAQESESFERLISRTFRTRGVPSSGSGMLEFSRFS